MLALTAKALRVLAPLAAYLATSGTAWAAQMCTISTTSVAFGEYNGSSTKASTGSVKYNCTEHRPRIRITLDTGSNSNTFTTRNMRRTTGTELLKYNLYLDAGATQIWGDGTGGTSIYSIEPPRHKDVIVTIFGVMPAHQSNLRVGNYKDTVTVTISW